MLVNPAARTLTVPMLPVLHRKGAVAVLGVSASATKCWIPVEIRGLAPKLHQERLQALTTPCIESLLYWTAGTGQKK